MNEGQQDEIEQNISKSLSSGRLLVMSIVSFVLYVLISLLIFHFYHEGGITNAFISDFSLNLQILIGVISGALSAAIIYSIIQLPSVSKALDDFYIVRILSKARFSFLDKFQLSFFAGTGEEILFRGAIQPLLGITLTSVIFVGIHGYFKFKTVAHFVFGVIMFGLSFVLGLLFEHVGLVAAMGAHAVYDVIMLQVVQRKNK